MKMSFDEGPFEVGSGSNFFSSSITNAEQIPETVPPSNGVTRALLSDVGRTHENQASVEISTI